MKERKLKEYIPLTLKGMAMGAADVVPGVSGGTMAFILGIYEELIHSIHTIASVNTIKMLASFKFKEAYNTLPWRFLAAVGLGVLSIMATLAKLIKLALENYEVFIWSFFFGLVVASIISVLNKVHAWSFSRYISLIIGTITAYLIVDMTPKDTPEAWWFIFLSGVIAICAMILPGISGSFLLVLMGKYKYILTAGTTCLSSLMKLDMQTFFENFMILAYFGAGTVVGLATFARILDWIFKKAHDLAVSLLIGFMVGSLWKIWPWKVPVLEEPDRHGKMRAIIQDNVLPDSFNSEVLIAAGLAVFGFVLIVALTRLANKPEKNIDKVAEVTA